ncbi:MAG: ABC transporter substrate-binding protein [Acidimicrobiales bacterium]
MLGRRVGRWLGALGVLAMIAAGCGDDDDGDSGPTTTEAPDVSLPEGEPIKFVAAAAVAGIVAQPEVFDAADAAVEAINADGGIPDPAGGPNRPLEVVRCEAGAGGSVDPDVALKCAQETIAEGVIAVVGRFLLGPDGTQAWAQAGIPMIGTAPSEAEDFINPLVYPISGGALTGPGGVAVALQEEGAETIALVTGDVAAGRALPGLMTPVLESPDDLVNQTYLPLDPSADFTTQIAQLVSANPDGVAVFGSTDINVRTIAGLRGAGYTGLIGMPTTGLGSDGLETLGETADGLIIVSDFQSPDDTGEAIDRFNAEMDAIDSDAPRTGLAVNAWASVHLFAEVLRDLDTIDPPSLLAALDGRPVDLGVAPPFTLNVPDNPVGAPRIFRVTFQVQEVQDGEILPSGDGEFLDLNDFQSG